MLVMSLCKTPTLHLLPNQPVYLSVLSIAENTSTAYFYPKCCYHHPLFFLPDAGLPSGGPGAALLVGT